MPFIYHRTVRFQDTDAAGVVYFANTLAMCHEAYEESLLAVDIQVKEFFSQGTGQGAVVIPIVHADVDYFHPAVCGDRHVIHLTPVRLSEHKFEVRYKIYDDGNPDHLVAQAQTRHVCINPTDRQRHPFPPQILIWLTKWG